MVHAHATKHVHDLLTNHATDHLSHHFALALAWEGLALLHLRALIIFFGIIAGVGTGGGIFQITFHHTPTSTSAPSLTPSTTASAATRLTFAFHAIRFAFALSALTLLLLDFLFFRGGTGDYWLCFFGTHSTK